MNPIMLGLLLVGGYLLLQGRAPVMRQPSGVPVYTGTPTGQVVSVPGVGRYQTGPAGTQITLDPSFFGRLFGRTPEPAADTSLPASDSPIFPSGHTSLNWSLGGAYDDYRRGERDWITLPDTVPLEPAVAPDEWYPQDGGVPLTDPCALQPDLCTGFDPGDFWQTG